VTGPGSWTTARPEPVDAPIEARIEARIEAALTRLGAEYEPAPGWEARVLAVTRAAQRRSRPWWWYAAPGLAIAAAAAILVQVLPQDVAPALALDIELERGATYRGADGHIGDVAHIAVSGGARRAIWIYHNEVQLVLRCPEDPACRVSQRATRVDLPLTRVGLYTIVALTVDAALPALAGTYDADLAAARRAGAADVQQRTLTVP
jgi:hypothetical protein